MRGVQMLQEAAVLGGDAIRLSATAALRGGEPDL